MRLKLILFFATGFVFISSFSFSQIAIDSSKTVNAPLKMTADTTKKSAVNDSVKTKIHSPKRAALYSAILPGLGQAYNKKYWKMPIVYAGGVVAAYLIYYNYTVYNNVHLCYLHRKDSNTENDISGFSLRTVSGKLTINLDQFNDEDLLSLQDSYRRDLDLSVLLAAGIYGLNIIDAVVDAHLFNFDVSDKLSFHFQPQLMPRTAFTQSNTGLSLRMTF